MNQDIKDRLQQQVTKLKELLFETLDEEKKTKLKQFEEYQNYYTIEGIVKELGSSEQSIALLDWSAMICSLQNEESNRPKLFASARSMERKLKIKKTPEAELQDYIQWAQFQLIPNKTLVTYLNSLAKAKCKGLPIVTLIVEWMNYSGERRDYYIGDIDEKICKSVEKIAEAWKDEDFVGMIIKNILQNYNQEAVNNSIWVYWDDEIAKVIFQDEGLQKWATSFFPEFKYREKSVAWINVLQKSGCYGYLKNTSDKRYKLDWLVMMLTFIAKNAWTSKIISSWIIDNAEFIAELADGEKLKLRTTVYLKDIIALVNAGVSLSPPEDEWRLHKSEDWDTVVEDMSIEVLMRHSELKDAVKSAIKMMVEYDSYDASWIDLYGDEWKSLLANISEKEQRYTLADYFNETEGLGKSILSCHDEITGIEEMVKNSDTADFMMNTLRLGLLDEWGWEALDKVREEIPGLNESDFDGAFPVLCINADTIKKIIVIGPEGEIARLDKPNSFTNDCSGMRYVDGDILYKNGGDKEYSLQWLSDPDKKTSINFWTSKQSFLVKTPKGKWYEMKTGIIDKGASRLKAKHEARYFFSNGEKCWSSDSVYNTKARKSMYLTREFNPDTGKFTEENTPLEWIASKIGDEDAMYQHCEYYPVPESLTNSPLGNKDGQYGFRLWREDKDFIVGETISGKSIKWKESNSDLRYVEIPKGFMSFPERSRDSLLLIYSDDIFLSDIESSSLIVPQYNFEEWWKDEWLTMKWWHLFTPRDCEGSKALANCTKEQAQKLLDIALGHASNQKFKDLIEDKTFMLQEVSEVFPQITHKKLIEGIAHICKIAIQCEGDAKIVRGRLKLAEKKAKEAKTVKIEEVPKVETPNYVLDTEVEAFGDFLKNRKRFNDYEYNYEKSLSDAFAFLNNKENQLGYYELTNSHVNWPQLSKTGGAILWLILTSGENEKTKRVFVKGMEVWANSALLQNITDYRVFEAKIQFDYKKVDFNSRYIGMVTEKSRYVVCKNSSANDHHLIIEKAADGTFTDLPNSEMGWEVKGSDLKLGSELILSTLKHYEENGSAEFNKDIVTNIAKEISVDYATAALMWTSSIYHEKEDAAFMKAIKVKRAEEDVAKWELFQCFDKDKNIILEKAKNFFELKELLSKLLPPNPVSVYKPEEKDENGISASQHFINVWKQEMGLRRPLDLNLMQVLKKDFQDPNGLYYYDVRILENPSSYKGLTSDEKWGMPAYDYFPSINNWDHGSIPQGWPQVISPDGHLAEPDENNVFTNFDFKRFMKLLSWAHLEMPANFPQKKALCEVAELIGKRLENQDLLMLAGAVNLVDKVDKDVTEEFNELVKPFVTEPYTIENTKHAEGYDRGDVVVTWPEEKKNGVFIAFRPACINSTEKLERIVKELGIYDVFKRGQSFCACGLNFGRNSTPDITSLPHFLLWKSEGFNRLLEIYKKEDAPKDQFYADPRFSVPHLVKQAREKLELSENGACLLLQIITLPDPNQIRIMRYNGWKKTVYQEAEDELKQKKLVEVRNITRTKRLIFMSGKIDTPSPPAAPLEQYKTALYGLEYDKKNRPDAPYGLILPQRPLNEIFEEAWELYKEKKI